MKKRLSLFIIFLLSSFFFYFFYNQKIISSNLWDIVPSKSTIVFELEDPNTQLNKILSEISFDGDNLLNNFLDKDFFINEKYRKLSLIHLKNIIEARIEEMIDISFNNNINIIDFKKSNRKIFLNIRNKDISKNLANTITSKIELNKLSGSLDKPDILFNKITEEDIQNFKEIYG